MQRTSLTIMATELAGSLERHLLSNTGSMIGVDSVMALQELGFDDVGFLKNNLGAIESFFKSKMIARHFGSHNSAL
jgi:hypothetical protein